MTSSTETRCEPRFPTAAVLIDNSALVRFWKCGALHALRGTVRIVVSGQVSSEFRKQGPAQRAALDQLDVEVRPIRLGTPAFDILSTMRGGKASTRDLGDAESIALALDARGKEAGSRRSENAG